MESLWKKLFLIIVFIVITPITLLSSVFSLTSIAGRNSPQNSGLISSLQNVAPGAQVYASLPSTLPSIEGEIIEGDARPEIIRVYLKDHDSPLSPFSNFLVEMADKYDLDYRLLTAIAQKESGLCKAIPEDSHNCWGWGIHSQGTLKFDSYNEAIEVVSRGIKQSYIDEGYETVEEIMQKYAHPDSSTWAEGVIYYMNQLL